MQRLAKSYEARRAKSAVKIDREVLAKLLGRFNSQVECAR